MRKTRYYYVAALAASLAFLAIGCKQVEASSENTWPKAQAIGQVGENAYIFVFKDNENGNVCYTVLKGFRETAAAVSCVPMEDTYNEQR